MEMESEYLQKLQRQLEETEQEMAELFSRRCQLVSKLHADQPPLPRLTKVQALDLEGKKATGNKNVISDEDDSSAPEESTDTSVTNPDDAQNTTDTNPSGGGHSTDSSTDSTIDGNVPQGTEDISGGTISNSNKSVSAGGSSESSSTGGESSGESDTTQ